MVYEGEEKDKYILYIGVAGLCNDTNLYKTVESMEFYDSEKPEEAFDVIYELENPTGRSLDLQAFLYIENHEPVAEVVSGFRIEFWEDTSPIILDQLKELVDSKSPISKKLKCHNANPYVIEYCGGSGICFYLEEWINELWKCDKLMSHVKDWQWVNYGFAGYNYDIINYMSQQENVEDN